MVTGPWYLTPDIVSTSIAGSSQGGGASLPSVSEMRVSGLEERDPSSSRRSSKALNRAWLGRGPGGEAGEAGKELGDCLDASRMCGGGALALGGEGNIGEGGRCRSTDDCCLGRVGRRRSWSWVVYSTSRKMLNHSKVVGKLQWLAISPAVATG